MRLIATVHNMMAKKPINIDDVKIEFKYAGSVTEEQKAEHRANVAALAKAAWSARLGIDLSKVKPEDGLVTFGPVTPNTKTPPTKLSDPSKE